MLATTHVAYMAIWTFTRTHHIQATRLEIPAPQEHPMKKSPCARWPSTTPNSHRHRIKQPLLKSVFQSTGVLAASVHV